MSDGCVATQNGECPRIAMFPVSATGSAVRQPDPRLALVAQHRVALADDRVVGPATATRLVAGDFRVRADVVERARQDRDEYGARVRAADRGAVVSALAGG